MSEPADPVHATRGPDRDARIALALSELLAGRPMVAAAELEALLSKGHDIKAGYWLAAALGAAGDRPGFEARLAEARTLHALQIIQQAGGDLTRLQAEPDYAASFAQQLYGLKLVAVAEAAYACAAAGPAPSAQTLIRLGLSLQHQGRMAEAASTFAGCEARHPGQGAFSFLLYSLFHVEDGVRRHAQAAAAWRAAHPIAIDAAPRRRLEPMEGRALRIGYMVPSLGVQARQFLTPVLEHHDVARVSPVLYMHQGGGAPAGMAVRDVSRLPDAAVADLVREDGIDVLVDLWGHAANGRLGVFLHRPAPVQASWLNYVQTTGIPEIDYLLHCDCMHTPDAQAHCVETIWPLGPIIAPFRPDARPEPTPTPALAKGYVTFGSYNHPSRLNDQTVAAWAAILRRTPGSRLVLRYGYFVDPVLQNTTLIRFAAHGVDPDRIACLPALTQPDYYRSFADIDIALDPSPCPGGTTSLDAVANGVPLLTLAGEDYYSRIGIAVVGPLGLDETLVAWSWEDYVARAVALAADAPGLDRLRREVRTRFDASGRRDEAGFTRRLEDAFHAMYEAKRLAQDTADNPHGRAAA